MLQGDYAPVPRTEEVVSRRPPDDRGGESDAHAPSKGRTYVKWLLFAGCGVCYVQGMTMPLAAASMENKMGGVHHSAERNNIRLMQELFHKNNVVGGLTLVLCVVVIPAAKFAMTTAMMLRPRWLRRKWHCSMAGLLCELSPYQFNDILLACLVVAYVNLDIAEEQPIFRSYVQVSARVLQGFWWFLCYCLFSVALSQLLEMECKTMFSAEEAQLPVVAEDASAAQAAAPARLAVQVVVGNEDVASEGGLEEQSVKREARRQNGPKFVLCSLAWAASVLLLLLLPLAPLSSQIRAADISISDMEPTTVELFTSLTKRDPFLGAFVVMLVVVVPLLLVVLPMLRLLLDFKASQAGMSTIAIAELEQLLRPWALGEVAGLALTSYYLSAQDHSHDFIFMCTRIPSPGYGFCLWIAAGAGSWGIRHYAPAPGEEAKERRTIFDAFFKWPSAMVVWSLLPVRHPNVTVPESDSPPSPRFQRTNLPSGSAADADVEPQDWVFFSVDDPFVDSKAVTRCPALRGLCKGACRTLPLRLLAVWAMWCTTLIVLGPSSPSRAKTLPSLNAALHDALPTINHLVRTQFPSTVGDCQEHATQFPQGEFSESGGSPVAVTKRLLGEATTNSKLDRCLGNAPLRSVTIGVEPLQLNCMVLWASGVNTMMLEHLAVVPTAAATDGTKVPSQRSWELQLAGRFDRLKLWSRAMLASEVVDDGYFCCQDQYHFSAHIAAECQLGKGFLQNGFRVTDVEIDNLQVNVGVGEETFAVDLAGETEAVKSALRDRMQVLLDDAAAPRGGETSMISGDDSMSIADVLNGVVRANFPGQSCPPEEAPSSGS